MWYSITWMLNHTYIVICIFRRGFSSFGARHLHDVRHMQLHMNTALFCFSLYFNYQSHWMKWFIDPYSSGLYRTGTNMLLYLNSKRSSRAGNRPNWPVCTNCKETQQSTNRISAAIVICNASRPRQNRHNFVDNISKCIFPDKNFWMELVHSGSNYWYGSLV